MVVMVSVAPPGGAAEGGEDMVTLADHKHTNNNNRSPHMYDAGEEEEADDFRPLVIDTHTTRGATSMEQDKQRLLHQLSRDMALYRENNPSDTELEGFVPPQVAPGSVFPGPNSDSSTPSSRMHSPALSTASNSGSTGKPGKQCHPNKARRKTDKILPGDGGRYVCPICQACLVSNTELTKHIRSHNSGGPVSANACTICGKVLSSQSSLDRHMLVHSGERPFKCKYCTMSFTTNGNMHRHSRIHDKEVRSEARGVSKVAPSPSRYPPTSTYSQVGFSSPLIKGNLHRELPPSGSKRKLSFDPRDESLMSSMSGGSPSSKRRSLGIVGTTSSTVSPREFTIMSPDGRAVNAVTPSPPHAPKVAPANTDKAQEAPKSEQEQQEFQCPECSMSFLCRYGLESHLQTHPNFTFSCQLCPKSFHSRQDLVMHKFQDHRCSVLYNSDKRPAADLDAAVGFHELDFIDFTCDKFPLIAQAWCDENVHYPSSAFHDFTCGICKKAFPCKDALRIHSNTHAPDDMTACQECDIHLTDHRAHTNHMLSHIAPKVVSHVSKTEGADSPQDVVSKEDFLTCFGLTVSKGEAGEKEETSEKPAVDLRKDDRVINEEYYPLLQRMARMQAERRKETAQAEFMALRRTHDLAAAQSIINNKPRPLPSRDSDSGSDLADIQQILSHFGSGGSLVNIGQSFAAAIHGSPRKDTPDNGRANKAFNPMVMIPGQKRHGPSSEVDNGMRLPVMVSNGFVPIPNGAHPEEPSMANETFQCKYCPEVFNNFKSYKSHTRAHLGLAPYKCSLCPYTSADKSTLIRHLRIHNGERPFQCRICEFAFTTKANCERHVRKKHMRFSKKDIDDVITYNQYPGDSAADVESFGSPDTVCKFCGEDFKFFRALKHHVRSHSSCTRKPFMCRICENGFSTKANVVRHVQKHHPQVEQHRLEDQIYTNELLAAEVAEDTKVYESIEAMDRAQSPALGSSTPRSMFGHAVNPIVISPIPQYPTALTPPPLPPSMPASHTTFITSPPILTIKPEMRDTSDEQPLDFSMKSASHSAATTTPEQATYSRIKLENSHMSGGHAIECRSGNSDEPMDLTVRQQPVPRPTTSRVSMPPTAAAAKEEYPHVQPFSSTPARHPAMTLSDLPPDVAARALPQLLTSKTTPDYGMLRYKKEYQKYYSPTLQVHIRSHTNERPFSCAYCSASFTIKTNLERHLKTRHPMEPQVIPDVAPVEAAPSNGQDEVVVEPPQPEVKVMVTPPQGGRSPRSSHAGSDDSNCDLSSVNKILDVATNANHFRSFFTTPISDESVSESPQANVSPFAQYRERSSEERSNHSSRSHVVEDEVEEEEDEESEDEDNEVVQYSSNTHLSPEDIIRQTTENLPIIKIRNPKSLEKTDDGSPAKKKRNSYADSPHKLMCPYCPRAFPWISSLNRHILTHTGQKPFKCPQCPVMFSTKSNRERHLVRKHGLNVLDPATRQMMDRPFKCHLCVFSSFSNAGNLKMHYQEKHPEEPMPEHLVGEEDANNNTDTYTAECEENNEVAEASKAKRLEFEMEDDEDSKDGITDGLGNKLMDHVQSSMLTMSPSTTPTPTSTRPISPAPSSPSPSVTRGDDTRHAHVNPERDNYNVDKITECWKCEEEFSSRKGLLRHLKEHNIDLAFKCYLCDASYEQRLDCVEHMSQKHPADWTVLCDKNQIGDIDEFADCMNRIVEQNFIGNTGFGKKLTEAEIARYKVQLLDDMKPESDYTQRKVYCALCPKRFWSLQDLRRHMRSHTGERPFECDLCQKRFTLKHSMMRHRRKHTDAGANSLSASDDEAGHIADIPERSHRSTPTPEQHRLEAAVARVSAAGGMGGSLAARFGSDLLHNLLGVEDSAIDEMLNSYSADAAARVLGVQQ